LKAETPISMSIFLNWTVLLTPELLKNDLSLAPLDENVNVSRAVIAVDQLDPAVLTSAYCRWHPVCRQVPAVGKDHGVARATKASVPDEFVAIHDKSIWVGVSPR